MSDFGVKEVFLTLQGEGTHTGRRAVFVRFAGCNLWTGREQDRVRGRGACARWCDTDFFKGDAMDGVELLRRVDAAWGDIDYEDQDTYPFVVFTGGEPMLQLASKAGAELLQTMHGRTWTTAVETNGTVDAHPWAEPDWICVAPKLGAKPTLAMLEKADEIKVVLPGSIDGPDWTEADLLALERWGDGANMWVQPLDVPRERRSLMSSPQAQCLAWIHQHPRWRLGLQMHKVVGLP